MRDGGGDLIATQDRDSDGLTGQSPVCLVRPLAAPCHSTITKFQPLGFSVKKLLLLCSTAVVMPTAAFAQSTGSVDFEKETIVVTGARTQDVGGIQTPDAPKAKAVVTQE